MAGTITNKQGDPGVSVSMRKLLFVLSNLFLSVAGLAMLQDFLESKRNGFTFYFDESLLYKTVWTLFIPILAFLYRRLQKASLKTAAQTAIFIVTPILIHLFCLPLIAVMFSELFYGGRYDLYKFFSYTLINHLSVLFLVYTIFVLGFSYWLKTPLRINEAQNNTTLATIIINNGKDNVVVNIDEIIQITSATPYIYIHLENRKYLHPETLRALSEQLDSNVFVRVHKSTLVNITKVSSFRSRLNGDYDLEMTTGELVRLSRTYAAGFKKTIRARSSG
ncbi:LytTr DNA-binding domain-containing protein [Pseudobacter ginsenosidimutans]|uniref:LytTr DNA-binding domain-containing protein n=2 Tax=Pseudobacter ginsenosidimutans TaxID=661488 RepID=A0A4Q7N2Y1_9BACT|nr:LytTR family transcriptional regulator [Pseudobacter ginsenosidimutans]RZS75429.1 LytTr DNA-binding domain-containing protein [Pseudobacter ginsenosidimutans]